MGHLYRPKVKRKNGTVYESPTWWAKYYVNGRPVWRSTGRTKVTQARRILKSWEGNPKAADPRQDKVTFNELVEDYLNDYRINQKKSMEQAEDYAERLLKHFGGRRAVSITSVEIREYIAQRQAEGYANGTINRDLAALKRVFNLAMQAEKLTRRPYIPRLDERNVRQGFLGELEHLAVTERLPFVLKVAADTAYHFGWRKEEVFGLQWPQVDLNAGVIRLEPGTTKNDEGRYVALTDGLAAHFKELWAQTRALEQKTGQKIPWVFHRKGKPIKDFRKAWSTACEKAGVGKRYFHDYRRTAVRNMEMAGVPRSTAMKITGHKTESVYRRYAIVDMGMLRDAAKKIEQHSGLGGRAHGPTYEEFPRCGETKVKQGARQKFGDDISN